MTNIFKVLLNKFKNKQPKKTNETIKKTQIGFIGKTKTVEIIDNQDVVDLVTASYGQITNETDDKLNKLKAYSDDQDLINKKELTKTIQDNKTESDNADADLNRKIQQNTTQINAVNQTANTANNTANTATQNANNALTVANRADNQSKNNKNDITTNKNRLSYLERRTSNTFCWRNTITVNGNMWNRQIIANNFARYLSNQTPTLTIPRTSLDKSYEFLSSKDEKDNNTQISVMLVSTINVYIKVGNLFYGFSDMLRGPFDSIQIQLNKTNNNDYIIDRYNPLSLISNARLDNSSETTIHLEYSFRRR